MHTQHTSKLSVSYYQAIIAEAEQPRNRNHLVTARGLASPARDSENTSEIIIVMVYVFLMILFSSK